MTIPLPARQIRINQAARHKDTPCWSRNRLRGDQGLGGKSPDAKADRSGLQRAGLERYVRRSHRHGLFELPLAAGT